ncbi:MAG: UDP-glucose/GDP-mannose dehydrogenase family protein [Spirochaetales bacterium]|nr:UDP-glucose/GDP-mannose dehydrogenase family protein [Spirochaetales bacterium]
MAKDIAVIGTGYVGLVAAVGLADFGNRVVGVDLVQEKVDSLNAGVPTIYETGITEYLGRNLEAGRLSFSTDIEEAVAESEVVFLAVGTPPGGDGNADLSQIRAALESIAGAKGGYTVVVTKSTVPVGTNRWIKEELERLSGSAPGEGFDVVSNPEFLREGKAVYDFFHPDRVVVGTESERAREVMEDIYSALYIRETPFLWCNIETAELIKYAGNAFLAVKISFINEMANLAEAVGADIHKIAKAMGMDGRISPKFLHPGPGYGGSCFPKDTRALEATAAEHGVASRIVTASIGANAAQKERMFEKLARMVGGDAAGAQKASGGPASGSGPVADEAAAASGPVAAGALSGKTIALLGLAFKAETDDIRESPALTMAERLLDAGAHVRAHDPKAVETFSAAFPPGSHGAGSIEYASDEFAAAEGADALVIMTEWNEYRNLDLERCGLVMKEKRILDTRNLLDPEDAAAMGFTYQGVGK